MVQWPDVKLVQKLEIEDDFIHLFSNESSLKYLRLGVIKLGLIIGTIFDRIWS